MDGLYEGDVRIFKGHPHADTVITVIFFYTPAITGEAVKQASGVVGRFVTCLFRNGNSKSFELGL